MRDRCTSCSNSFSYRSFLILLILENSFSRNTALQDFVSIMPLFGCFSYVTYPLESSRHLMNTIFVALGLSFPYLQIEYAHSQPNLMNVDDPGWAFYLCLLDSLGCRLPITIHSVSPQKTNWRLKCTIIDLTIPSNAWHTVQDVRYHTHCVPPKNSLRDWGAIIDLIISSNVCFQRSTAQFC